MMVQPPQLSAADSPMSLSSLSPNHRFVAALCIYFFAHFRTDLDAMNFGPAPPGFYPSYYPRFDCPQGNAYLISSNVVLFVIAALYFIKLYSSKSSSLSSTSSCFLTILLPISMFSLFVYSIIMIAVVVPNSCDNSNSPFRRVLLDKAIIIIVVALIFVVDIVIGVLLSFASTPRRRFASTTTTTSVAEHAEEEDEGEDDCSSVCFTSSLSSFLSLFSLPVCLVFVVSFAVFPFCISYISFNHVKPVAIAFNVILAVVYAVCMFITVVAHRVLWWRFHQLPSQQPPPRRWSFTRSLLPFVLLLASPEVRQQLSSNCEILPTTISSENPPSSSSSSTLRRSKATPSSSSSSSSTASSSSSVASPSSLSSVCTASTRHLFYASLSLFLVVLFVFALITLIVETQERDEDAQAIFVTSLNLTLVTITMIRVLFAYGCLFSRRVQIRIRYVNHINRKRRNKRNDTTTPNQRTRQQAGSSDEDEDDDEDDEEEVDGVQSLISEPQQQQQDQPLARHSEGASGSVESVDVV